VPSSLLSFEKEVNYFKAKLFPRADVDKDVIDNANMAAPAIERALLLEQRTNSAAYATE